MTTILHETVLKGRNIAASTRDRYIRDIDLWIAYAGNNPDGWTRDRAQAFYDHLIASQGLAAQSANRVLASVRYASKWWSHRLNRPDLDFAVVQKASGRKIGDRRQAIDQIDATKLIQICLDDQTPAGKRDLAIMIVGLETGMRRMSIRSMLIEQTFAMPILKVPSYPHTMVFAKGTAGERVPVPLSDTTIRALDHWLAWLDQDRGPMFRGIDEKIQRDGRNHLVASSKAISESSIAKIIERRCEQAKIAHINPHMFRHTFVTWRFAAGLLPHEIAAVTGHTITGIGALAGYIDMKAIAEKVRNSTPEWLREMIP